MCGIAGIWDRNERLGAQQTLGAAKQMGRALTHRGPDDDGLWHDEAAGLALAHRRLAIVDLSPLGAQPMVSACGRYTLCYNGEIYNFRDLRKQLSDYPFKGESDSEVLLAALASWGIEQTLKTAHGMFAFAFWDKQERCLSLARDRIGEKPLYYTDAGGIFAFASELKAITQLAHFEGRINREALTQYVGYSYVPAPQSIYEGVYKLPAGCYGQLREDGELRIRPYWRLQDEFSEPKLNGNATALTDALEATLKRAVKQMMIADVPLGAFLSGGIDSSSIAALMQTQSSKPVKTFSIGFDENGFDEAPYAKAVAQHLGTDHTELYVSAKQALDVIPQMPQLYDEPFADDSQIPTYLVAKMAREHVTVALSGDAGDELFGGYTRYLQGPRLWHAAGWMPSALRKSLAAHLIAPFARLVGQPKIAHYAHKLRANDAKEFYRYLCQSCNTPQRYVLGAHATEPALADCPQTQGLAAWMMAQDTLSYLPDDILVKVDRAAMACSLETRVPFLHPDVIAFACALPDAYKIHNGQGKWLLRQLLYRHVPKTLIERPKAGFAIPLASWLRGPLKDWAAQLLAPNSLTQQGFFDSKAIQTLWQQHQAGSHNHQHLLWNILMFQGWLHTSNSR